MASPRALRLLRELQSDPDNKASLLVVAMSCLNVLVLLFSPLCDHHPSLCCLFGSDKLSGRRSTAGLLRLQLQVSSVGICILWLLHVPGVQREAPWTRRSYQFCQVHKPSPPSLVRECLERIGQVLNAAARCYNLVSGLRGPRGSDGCRSVTMDAWTDEQLNKMKLGGNKRLNDFLSKYEVDKLTPVIEKYHSRAAEVCSVGCMLAHFENCTLHHRVLKSLHQHVGFP